MGILKFTAVARQDLLEIWIGIALDNPTAADRVAGRIETACGRLRYHPNLGRSRPEIGDGAHALIVDLWVAFYKVEPEGVQIVDGVRDLAQLPWNLEPAI